MPRKGDRLPLADRFWSKVAVGPPGDCWLWTGARVNGYGSMKVLVAGRWRNIGAHRVSYMLAHDLDVPAAGVVRHRCDVPLCVNPAHLLLGTVADNVRDCLERGRHRYRENPRPGVLNGRAKLTDDDVREIRRLVDAGRTKASIARAFGVTDAMVGRIGRRTAWRDVT